MTWTSVVTIRYLFLFMFLEKSISYFGEENYHLILNPLNVQNGELCFPRVKW